MGGTICRCIDLTAQFPGFFHQFISQSGHFCCMFLKIGHSCLCCSGKGCDLRHGLGARAQTALLIAAVDQRLKMEPLPDIEGTAALQSAQLVGRQAHQVDDIHRQVDLAEGLHRIHMEQRLGADLLYGGLGLPQGQNRSCFVTHCHQADHRRIGAQGSPDGLGRYTAIHFGCHQRHLIALTLQGFQGVQGGVVLDLGGHDVLAQMLVFMHRTAESGVGAFAAARSEGHTGRLDREGCRHRFPAVIQHFSRRSAYGVQRTGIAEVVHGGNGRLPGTGQNSRGGGVVQIMFH